MRSLGDDVEKRELLCAVGVNVKLVQRLWKKVWRFLKRLKIELPYDPAIPLLGIYPKETKPLSRRDFCTAMFIAVLFIIAKA